MNASNIAFLDEYPGFYVREDRGDYHVNVEAHDAAADSAKDLYEAQGQIGDAMNLAGLLLASLEDQGDRRAMQIHTVVTVIEEKLKKAYNRLDKHEARYTKLHLAYASLRNEAKGID